MSGKGKPVYVSIAEAAAIEEGGSRVFYVFEKEIAVFRVDGRFYAIDNRCPHRQEPLCAGEVAGPVVICPLHGARFDLRTGRGLPGPHQTDVASYDVLVADGTLKIKAPAR